MSPNNNTMVAGSVCAECVCGSDKGRAAWMAISGEHSKASFEYAGAKNTPGVALDNQLGLA